MSCDYVKCFRYARMVPGMKVGDDVTTDPQGYWYGAITNKANPINNCVIIVVVNDKRYAGTCSFWGSGACIGMCGTRLADTALPNWATNTHMPALRL